MKGENIVNKDVARIKAEVEKVVSGKGEMIDKVVATVIAGGHILLEDIPGVGKTTLALALSKALGLSFNRVQFTPDVVPSDITGFTMYQKETGQFKYIEGSILCNFFLADEINRTSSKTQSALLEVMQEGKVTVDGISHQTPKPFVVMATQNPLGSAGTQMLPEAQLDRFMIRISMGYPSFDAQIEILQRRSASDPMEQVEAVCRAEDVEAMKKAAMAVDVDEKIYRYVTALVEATRDNEYIKLGASPRAALALVQMAKAKAYMQERGYVIPEDVEEIYVDVCAHRLIMDSRAIIEGIKAEDVLKKILEQVKPQRIQL